MFCADAHELIMTTLSTKAGALTKPFFITILRRTVFLFQLIVTKLLTKSISESAMGLQASLFSLIDYHDVLHQKEARLSAFLFEFGNAFRVNREPV